MIEKEKYFSDRIYLRLLTLDDVSAEYLSWLNNPQINKYMETWEMTMDKLKDFVSQRVNNPKVRFYGIFDKTNDKHIGNVKLEPIDWQKKNAVFGIMIGNPDYFGQGIGSEVTKLIIDIAFNYLELEEVHLGAIAENKKAVRAYEKAGFKITEHKNKSIYRDGILFDGVYMKIKKQDYVQ